MAKPKAQWLIIGYDGTEETFRQEVSSALSTNEMKALLQRLACRHLSASEVIAASLRKRWRAYSPLLEVTVGFGKRITLMVGEDHHYVATSTEAESGETAS